MGTITRNPNSALKILVCYHKPFTMPPNENGIFLPVHVGRVLTDTDLHMQGDNEVNGQPCDNISSKNKCYCELTAIYWAWKNLRKLCPDVKYIGLCHYRRLFAFNESKAFCDSIYRNESALSEYTLNPAKIIDILEKGHIIAAKPIQFPYPVFVQYCMCCVSEDYHTLKSVIAEEFKDYYEDFVRELEHSNKTPGFNMFVMKWEDFTEYCEWLFSVLEAADRRINYQHYSTYQMRVLAFMSERLFKVWLSRNGKKLTCRNVYFYGEYDDRTSSRLKMFARWLFRLGAYLKNELTASLLIVNITGKILKLIRH